MRPNTFFKLIAFGLLSISLTSAATLKRFNRRRIIDSDTESESGNGKKSITEPVVAETSGIEALQASAGGLTHSEPLSAFEFTGINTADAYQSIDDRRMCLFNRIYVLYHDVIPNYAVPGSIEWHRVNVRNWPEYIEKSDISTWTDEQIDLLNGLIDSELLDFVPTSRSKKHPPKPLTVPFIIKKEPVNTEESEAIDAIEAFSNMDNARRVIRKDVFTSYSVPKSSSSFEDDFVVKKKHPSVKKSGIILSSSSSSGGSDSDSDFKSSKVPTKSVTRSSAAKKVKKPKTNSVQVRVDSDMPADPARRDAVISKVLSIYRSRSGDVMATEIDWTRSIVFYIQKHALPFSTDLETEGDVITLERLMKNKYFGFHNMNNVNSRRIKVYERLYNLYAAVAGDFAHDFHVKWEQVNINGWPKEIVRSYSRWNFESLDRLEALLDSDGIKFTLKKSCSEILSDESSDSDVSEAPVVTKAEYDSISGSSSEDEIVAPKFVKKEGKRARVFLYTDPESEHEAAAPVESGKKAKIEKVPESEAQVGELSEFTMAELGQLSTRINGTIEIFTSARETYSAETRYFKILSEMIKCLNLLLQHVTAAAPAQSLSPLPSPDQIPIIGIEEISHFLLTFRTILESISPRNDSDRELWQRFVIESIKLRARLAGIQYKTTVNGRRVLDIKRSRIADFNLFGFLAQSESGWVHGLQILESFLDSEDTLIFRQPYKRGVK